MSRSNAGFGPVRDGFVRRGACVLLLTLAACSGGREEFSLGEKSFALLADAGDAAASEHEHESARDAGDAAPHEHAQDEDAGADPSDGGVPPDPAADHCAMQMPIDPRDATLDPTPVVQRFGFSRDVLLPQDLIDWMDEHGLEEAHDAWHGTRRWDERCGTSFAAADGCSFAQSLLADELWRAKHQQGGPGAGLAFLHMHRHMITLFKASFPTHASIFDGWTTVPRSRDDPENPTPWRSISWSENALRGFDILENIEEHADEFANEDELGVFIESNFRWTPEDPVVALGIPGAGVHGSMHNQWTVSRSTANLGRTDTALRNFTFWKLHGFIDDVWTRYRNAQGLLETDPDYLAVAEEECRLMYYLAPEHRGEAPESVRAPDHPHRSTALFAPTLAR